MLSIPHKAHQSSRRHKERVVSKPQRILVVSDLEHAVSELPVGDADNYLLAIVQETAVIVNSSRAGVHLTGYCSTVIRCMVIRWI